MLDISTLENWLWEAACKIRGEIDSRNTKTTSYRLSF